MPLASEAGRGGAGEGGLLLLMRNVEVSILRLSATECCLLVFLGSEEVAACILFRAKGILVQPAVYVGLGGMGHTTPSLLL